MKPVIICLMLSLLSWQLQAQAKSPDAPKPPDPPFMNHVYCWQADTLLSLEQVDAQIVSKTKALGFGGGESGYAIKGERSPVRVKAGDHLRFAVKLAMADPSMTIKLYRFDIRKGGREAVLNSSGGPYSRGNKNNTSEISLNVQKSGQDLYIILPAPGLAPGEYGFLNMMMARQSGYNISYTVFAFGVD